MPESVTIRPVERDDYTQWKDLWAGYNAFYGRSGPTALSAKIVETTWDRFFDGYEPMYALVALRGNTMLGLAHFLLHRSTIALTPNCYLQDLFTHSAARGAGVGRALIAAVCEHAAKADAKRVYWQTHETNTTAMALYDKVAVKSGFIVYSKML